MKKNSDKKQTAPTGKRSVGRPPKDKYNIDFMCQKIKEYTQSSELPILKEACLENDWGYDRVMQLQREHPRLLQSIKKLLAKKEIILEKGLLTGKINTTGAIFVLKQPAHGWTDKPQPIENEVEDTEEVDKAVFGDEE